MKRKDETEFEEVEVECIGCGKRVRVIKRKGEKAEAFICQRCGQGEMIIDDD